jgi:hypothetical protein
VQIEKDCKSGLCSTYYATSYFLNGMLSSVEASGDEELLEQTIRYMDIMIQSAIPHPTNPTYHYWKHAGAQPDQYCDGQPDTGLDQYCRPFQKDHFESMVPFARAAFIISSQPTWRV